MLCLDSGSTRFAEGGQNLLKWYIIDELVRPLRLGGRLLATFSDGVPPQASFDQYYTAFLGWIRAKLGRRPAYGTGVAYLGPAQLLLPIRRPTLAWRPVRRLPRL